MGGDGQYPGTRSAASRRRRGEELSSPRRPAMPDAEPADEPAAADEPELEAEYDAIAEVMSAAGVTRPEAEAYLEAARGTVNLAVTRAHNDRRAREKAEEAAAALALAPGALLERVASADMPALSRTVSSLVGRGQKDPRSPMSLQPLCTPFARLTGDRGSFQAGLGGLPVRGGPAARAAPRAGGEPEGRPIPVRHVATLPPPPLSLR